MSVTVHRVHHPWVGKLGRVYVPDDGDSLHPLAEARMVAGPQPLRDRPWTIGETLNQGQAPKCVAFTGREWLNCEPNSDPDHDNPSTDTLYTLAQQNDGIPGAHDGSNDRGLMKGLQQLGLVDSYHWATGVDDAIDWLLHNGPLCCGADWTQGMFTPDSQGYIKPVGPVEGGHEFLAFWYDSTDTSMWFEQSWGEEWNPAFPGRFKIRRADLDILWSMSLDFCAALVAFPRPILPPPPSQ